MRAHQKKKHLANSLDLIEIPTMDDCKWNKRYVYTAVPVADIDSGFDLRRMPLVHFDNMVVMTVDYIEAERIPNELVLMAERATNWPNCKLAIAMVNEPEPYYPLKLCRH